MKSNNKPYLHEELRLHLLKLGLTDTRYQYVKTNRALAAANKNNDDLITCIAAMQNTRFGSNNPFAVRQAGVQTSCLQSIPESSQDQSGAFLPSQTSTPTAPTMEPVLARPPPFNPAVPVSIPSIDRTGLMQPPQLIQATDAQVAAGARPKMPSLPTHTMHAPAAQARSIHRASLGKLQFCNPKVTYSGHILFEGQRLVT